MKSRIGLFGGTFDPVHRGHLSIAQSYLNINFIDSLWIIPSAYSPHKPAIIADFHHRVEMLNLAFKGSSNILINTVESTLPEPGYTIQTLEYLQLTNSENEYYWCIGSDNLISFTSWHRYEDILDLCTLLVAKRPGSIIENVPVRVMDKSIIIEHNPVDISSSEIRESIRVNNNSSDIPKSVMNYIRKHNLYK